ncbi:MAG: glycoside hydrolase family 92 protein [Bacteroides sp.]|nr:glycoside hydrolase family 92 protein [Bacteroides sp.]
MKIYYLFAALPLIAAACSHSGGVSATPDNYTEYVDMKIGTGGHGHVFVGANVPFGMVQLGPTSIPQSWDWVSGYHDSDSTVIGFSHTHFSGTGIGDLFDITVMPVTGGDLTYARGTAEDAASGLWSYADRSKEVVRPGYYSVPLTRYGINAELTATNRVGLHRYTFPASDSAAIVIDLQNGGCWDKTTETMMEALNDSTVIGYRFSKGWAPDQKVYFVARTSKPFSSMELKGDNNMYGRLNFATAPDEQVMLKVALSPVSVEGAMDNLEAELPGWDFEATRTAAGNAWNSELARVRVATTDSIERTKFYTSLFHTMIAPSVYQDADGKYYGADGKIHQADGHTNYTTFSLWDTYRAAMPLMGIINPEKSADMVNTMLDICDQQGRLPVWHFWGNETDCMVGNPGIITVADAIVKNQPGLDRDRAYKALLVTVADTARGGKLREQYGFIPSDLMNESVAYDMEYAIADAAIARAAEAMGDTANMRRFTERSHSYRNYFDSSTGFIRGRMSDGSWRTPFDPRSSNHRADDYCEGNAWQYTWLVPQDLEGLEQLFGSREATVARLDSLFTTDSELTGELVSSDISGLIGQYAHGNEPSHHVIYFYTMLGEPDKAADRVRQVIDEMYLAEPNGLSGNEDVGQMSAWYILSALGFYQVEPASGRYWFGSPLFDSVDIDVPGGTFTVKTVNNSKDNKYIRSVKLNGKSYNKPYIMHSDIMNGGVLEFTMGPAE